jgi:uncharacterized delta-60 repeat protein
MAGQAQNGTYPAFGVARFTTAGVLDITFGNGGRVITPVGTTGIANSIAIQSDGKIVVAGESQDAVSYDFAVARYDTSGNLDNTFGTGGIVVTPIGTSTDIGYAMAIQSDGKIVVAGTSLIGTGSDFALVRYNTNGTLDNTFGTGGKVTTDFGSPNDICNSVAIQSNGKIVAGGQYYNGTNNDFAIARYNTNGALDATFGTGGKVTTPIGTRADVGYGVAIQSDGKIIMTGNSDNGTYINVAVVRYNSTGTLDNGFGTAGEVTTLIASGNSTGRSVLVQGDGKVVVAGYFLTGGYNDFAVARYNGGTVGIDEEAPENSFCIMPNPANNMFTLQLNSELKNAEVRIYDELGTEVFSESSVNAQQTQIDCNRFASGIYFVQVMDGEKLITKKLVIEKL